MIILFHLVGGWGGGFYFMWKIQKGQICVVAVGFKGENIGVCVTNFFFLLYFFIQCTQLRFVW